mmetsp:Transcript_17933/g.37199  ORF Transcript_17933/g.37199 Transcript_17933/m.37199 type:complete len:308 (-) Transcript_17933:287-1210(-)
MDRAQRSKFVSRRHGQEIVTYCWVPETEEPYRGILFLIHGLHSWTGHEFLSHRVDADGTLELGTWEGSFVEAATQCGFVVCAHDHLGHGNSGGLRAYFDVDDLVADTEQYFDEFGKDGAIVASSSLDGLPRFLMGVSMGGTVSISLAPKLGDRLRGAVLVSPAVKEPVGSFGPLGFVLKTLSALLNAMFPKTQVMKLPEPPLPELKRKWYADPLTWHYSLRVRPGRTMLEAYRKIDSNVAGLTFPMFVIIGTTDNLVNPEGMKEFVDKAGSELKELKVMEGMWHVLLDEPNGQAAIKAICDWLKSQD